jgi:hypothetical protein
MNYFERRRQQKSFEFCIKQAMAVLKITKEEAAKRVRRVSEMECLKDLGTPDKREYQVAVDIIMQIPSDKPVTVATMREVTDANIKSK